MDKDNKRSVEDSSDEEEEITIEKADGDELGTFPSLPVTVLDSF